MARIVRVVETWTVCPKRGVKAAVLQFDKPVPIRVSYIRLASVVISTCKAPREFTTLKGKLSHYLQIRWSGTELPLNPYTLQGQDVSLYWSADPESLWDEHATTR